jgi:hypothetical protein
MSERYLDCEFSCPPRQLEAHFQEGRRYTAVPFAAKPSAHPFPLLPILSPAPIHPQDSLPVYLITSPSIYPAPKRQATQLSAHVKSNYHLTSWDSFEYEEGPEESHAWSGDLGFPPLQNPETSMEEGSWPHFICEVRPCAQEGPSIS